MCQTTYACSTVHIREHRVRVPCRTQTKTLFNNELKTEMTTIIPLANRARSHIALTRPSWVSLASGERASGKRNPCKSEISQLLLEQFSSVFSTPSTDKKVTDPDSFFTYNIDGKSLLTDIIIDDEHIVSAVKEMSVTSSAGPEGLLSSFLKNCLPVLIKPLKILFRKSLDSGDIPAIFKHAA